MDLHQMTQSEIEKMIFEGRGAGGLVGLRQIFTDDQILMLPAHRSWERFDSGFQTLIESAMDTIFDEELGATQ